MNTELQVKQDNQIQVFDLELKKFELMQRKATMMSKSTLVPALYRAAKEIKGDYGKITGYEENPNAIANCVIAIDMANRMGANELMVMQNLLIIEGRPSWSSQWIIAMINGCGKFSPLRFEVADLGEKVVEYNEFSYDRVKKEKVTIRKTIKIHDFSCIAYATDKDGTRLESSKISIEMAVKEGWYNKNGSKWQTMPEVMLRYRAASFFGKIYAPELLMGLMSVEENQDIESLDLAPKYPNAVENMVQPIANNNVAPTKFKPIVTDPIIDITDISEEVKDDLIINPIVAKQAQELFNEKDK